MSKFKNLQFELGEKLGHHFEVKFRGESNGDSPNVQKRCLDPEMGHKGLVGAKNHKTLKFELGEKVDHYSWVKFRFESNGDSLDTLKCCLDP